jgi:hypothetical protein
MITQTQHRQLKVEEEVVVVDQPPHHVQRMPIASRAKYVVVVYVWPLQLAPVSKKANF